MPTRNALQVIFGICENMGREKENQFHKRKTLTIPELARWLKEAVAFTR